MRTSCYRGSRIGLLVVLSTAFMLIFSIRAFGSISISGTYLGKNLRIINPPADDGFGFSITKVTVNEQIVPLKFSGNEAEIDFSYVGLAPGSPVTVVIRSQNERSPVICNPEALGSPVITSLDESSTPVLQTAPDKHEPAEDKRMVRRPRKFVPADR